MKTREPSRQVRDKVVEKVKAGIGYKTISKALKVSPGCVQSIIQKSKEYGAAASLPRNGRAANQRIQSQRTLFAQALKRPVVILEKLPRPTAQGRTMDGVRWSSSRTPETFRTDTLSRLASFIARTDTKQHAPGHPPSHLPLYGCQECGKGFPFTKDLLQQQELQNVLPKPHSCPVCGQQFSLRSSLQLHECPLDSGVCDRCRGAMRRDSECAAATSNPGRLPEKPPHRQPRTLDCGPYACAPCGRGFNQKQALLQHQQAGCSESPSPSNRSIPGDSPPVSEHYSAHSDSSEAPGPVSACRLCSRTFCTEDALLRHFQDSHAETPDVKAPSDQEERTVDGKPKKRLKSKKMLLSCRSCDMVFGSTAKLYMHRKDKHSRDIPSRGESRPSIKKIRKTGTYPCQICGKVFFHHLSFRAHARRHAAEGSVPVQDSKSFQTSLATRKTHKAGPGRPRKRPRVPPKAADAAGASERKHQQQQEDSEFPCPSCAQVFSARQQLKEHVELHQSSVSRRQCSVCTCEMDGCKGPGSKRQRLYHCVPCQQGFSALDSFLEHCQEHLRVRVEEDRLSEGHRLQPSKACQLQLLPSSLH